MVYFAKSPTDRAFGRESSKINVRILKQSPMFTSATSYKQSYLPAFFDHKILWQINFILLSLFKLSIASLRLLEYPASSEWPGQYY